MAVEAVTTMPAAIDVEEDVGARPTEQLPLRQLLQISIYWLGINSIWGGVGVFTQERVPQLVPIDQAGLYFAIIAWVTIIVTAATQPTIGAISDYTISRWGRRKPYIAIGATLDVVFLVGLATSQVFLSLLAFLFLLQFSSNFAQGAFQGYVPDLVPQSQVGLASALVGMMQTIGFVAGATIITIAYRVGDFTLPLIFLGLVELATAVGTLLWVREGSAAKQRRGRSWFEIGRSAWGLDILRERSFVFLVSSRLMFMAGLNMLLAYYVVFFNRTFSLSDDEKAILVPVMSAIVAGFTALSTIPSGILSNRYGRKPLIYVACGIGSAGLLVAGTAPDPYVFLLGATLIGIGSGTFVAVDWALMTDIIPKASAGRYMGISNIAVAFGGPIASLVAWPFLDLLATVSPADGPRAAFLAGIGLFVLGALFLRPVDPTPREQRAAAATAMPSPA